MNYYAITPNGQRTCIVLVCPIWLILISVPLHVKYARTLDLLIIFI